MDSTSVTPGHPLQNFLVLSNLVKYLKFKELKNARLVSKIWNSACKTQFASKSIISFHDQLDKLKEYLDSSNSHVQELFINFKFVNVDFNVTAEKERRRMRRFTRKIGYQIREISLVQCFCTDYGEILNGFPNLVILSIALPTNFEGFQMSNPNPIENPTSENWNLNYDENGNSLNSENNTVQMSVNRHLKCLEVTGCPLDEGSDNENESQLPVSKINWIDFIQAFPNLENLGAQCRCSEDLTTLLSLLSTSPLKFLHEFSCVLTDMENSHVEMLAAATSSKKHRNNLTTLDLSLCENIDERVLISLISRHANSLRSLKLFRDCESKNRPLLSISNWMRGNNGSSLTALTSLELQCNMVESLDFIEITPNLKHLNLLQFGEGKVTFYNSIVRSTKASHFPKLQSFSYEYFLDVDCMEILAELFPNLIRISSYLTDESIRVIFREMGKIEEMDVFGTMITDEGITGCSINVLHRKYRYIKDYRKFPYIGNLKKLWKFTLHPQPQDKITDYSVLYGFLEAPSLTSIEMAETAISNEGVEKLQQKKNLVSLITPFFVDSEQNVFSRPRGLKVL